MTTDFVQIDAFTTSAFAGNPAAVCVLDGPADETWMQHVALEMNLSETAFLHAEDDAWRLRWFTPAAEVDLCGHATLATAHALWTEHGHGGELRFNTRSGVLTAAVADDGAITLDFPADPAAPADPPTGMIDALGVEPVAVGRGVTDYLVQVTDDATVRGLTPDMGRLRSVDMRGVIVTAANATDGLDIVSRFFAPGVGVDEDPVTGSAHTTLAPWWASILGRDTMRAEQASARGGVLDIELAGDRVRLTGYAVTTARGQLLV